MAKDIPLEERIIFALDVDSTDKAIEWINRLESHVHFYKVGLQLFMAGWFDVINELIKRDHKVMVDLKFFDIPETVELAVEELRKRKVTFATVHGNDPILRAAVKAKNGTKILAVTVLTSFGEDDMKEMGATKTVEELVYYRAKRAFEIGCDGVVSSGLEAQRLRKDLGDNFLIVTPGIRPGKNIDEFANDKDKDHKRITTAKEAIRNGADYVVIGRPIRDAKDPIAIVKDLQQEIIAAQNSL